MEEQIINEVEEESQTEEVVEESKPAKDNKSPALNTDPENLADQIFGGEPL